MKKKKLLLSDLDPAVVQTWELNVWNQITEAQKDMLLITFEFEKDKTYVDIQDMANMMDAIKLPIKNNDVRAAYFSAIIDRTHVSPLNSRPGFML